MDCPEVTHTGAQAYATGSEVGTRVEKDRKIVRACVLALNRFRIPSPSLPLLPRVAARPQTSRPQKPQVHTSACSTQ